MGIEIHVRTGLTAESSSVSATGSVQHVITDKERNTFGINDGQLKNAVGKYFGQNPDDAFLHSDTPWGDLYRTYGWPQVQTILVVESATITGITSVPTIVAHSKLRNNSAIKGTFTASASESVSNSTSSNWSTTDSIQVSQKFSYEVSFLGTGGKGETSLTYTHSWGQGGSETSAATVGSAESVSVALDAGQAVDVQITALRGTMKIRVVYKAYLTGDVAINYGHRFKDHHFWGLDIGGIMHAANIQPYQTFTEDIEIAYYANDEVVMMDPATGQPLAQINGSAKATGPHVVHLSIPKVPA